MHPSTRRRFIASVAGWLIAAAQFASAAPISPDALFLSPALVPTDDYTNGRTFSTIDSAFSLHLTAGSLPDLPSGITFTGARILPLLSPNPATAEGEYTDADLGAITAENYDTYFFRVPGMDSSADYWADLESDSLDIFFNETGQYFLTVDFLLNGVSASTTFYHVEVDDFFGGDGAKDKAGVSRTITGPTTDFNVVSTTPPGDNGFADNAAKELTDRLGADRVTRAGTLKDACQAIKDASQTAGRKLTVSLVGHGRPGSIRLGTERINSDTDGVMTATQFQECIDPYVSHIEFWSCDTAQGDVGTQFLRDFAASIGSASGFTVKTTAAKTYWDVSAGGKKGTEVVPEPATLLLLSLGLLGCGRRLRRSGR